MRRILGISTFCMIFLFCNGCSHFADINVTSEINSNEGSNINQTFKEEMISTIKDVSEIYKYSSEEDLTEEQIAEELITLLLKELKFESEIRTYNIIEYKNLSISFDNYNEYELRNNERFLSGTVDVIFEGTLSPIGADNIVPEGEYVHVNVGEWILEMGDECIIRRP